MDSGAVFVERELLRDRKGSQVDGPLKASSCVKFPFTSKSPGVN